MLVNLAGGVIENAGISLDRCFGLPFIPGSAVKGLTRSQALREIHDAGESAKAPLLRRAMLLFGYGQHDLKGDFAWAATAEVAQTTAAEIGALEYKGCACFLPAYPTNEATIVVDMLNPHYPQYYAGNEPHALDIDNPVPNYFPAVEIGSRFGFAVLLNRVPNIGAVTGKELLDQAKQWLERVITRRGVGAKTAAGYGWFRSKTTDAAAKVPVHSDLFAPSEDTPEAVSMARQALGANLPDEGQTVYLKWCNQTINGMTMPALTRDLDKLSPEAALAVLEVLLPEAAKLNRSRQQSFWADFTNPGKNPKGAMLLDKLGVILVRA